MNHADRGPGTEEPSGPQRDGRQPPTAAVDRVKARRSIRADLVLAACAAVAIGTAGTISLLMAQAASATPVFARRTGNSCVECHTSAKGGALTPYGEKFQANGDKLPTDAKK